jgi:hypothetical protein
MRTLHKVIISLTFALSTSAAMSRSAGADRSGGCGPTESGIALCLAAGVRGSVLLEIENQGASDAVLDLGVVLANGARQYPTAIRLTLTDSHGVTHRAQLAEPAAVAGRLDPFIVPLPAGAALRLPLALSKYALYDSSAKLEQIGLAAYEQYTMSAELTGRGVGDTEANLDMKGLRLLRYWMGTAMSNTITGVR